VRISKGISTEMFLYAGTSATFPKQKKIVSPLDLLIDISSGQLLYSTFRKAGNAYNNSPADSCHVRSQLAGIVFKELNRTPKTNSSFETFIFQVWCLFSTMFI